MTISLKVIDNSRYDVYHHDNSVGKLFRDVTNNWRFISIQHEDVEVTINGDLDRETAAKEALYAINYAEKDKTRYIFEKFKEITKP